MVKGGFVIVCKNGKIVQTETCGLGAWSLSFACQWKTAFSQAWIMMCSLYSKLYCLQYAMHRCTVQSLDLSEESLGNRCTWGNALYFLHTVVFAGILRNSLFKSSISRCGRFSLFFMLLARWQGSGIGWQGWIWMDGHGHRAQCCGCLSFLAPSGVTERGARAELGAVS